MERFLLQDEQWQRIEPLLPGKAKDVGVTCLRRWVIGIPRSHAFPGGRRRAYGVACLKHSARIGTWKK